MAQATKSAKELGDKGFLRRLTLATAWGEGLDGFDLTRRANRRLHQVTAASFLGLAGYLAAEHRP